MPSFKRLSPVLRRHWQSALLSAVSLLLLASVMAQQTVESWRTHRGENVDKAVALNRSVRSHADVVIDAVAADLRAIALVLARDPGLLGERRDALSGILAQLGVDERVAGLFVVDPAGRVVAVGKVAGEAQALPAPSSRPLHLAAELERHNLDPSSTTLLSAPFRSGLVDGDVFTISVGVRAPDGAFLGMVAAAMPVERLLSLFLELRPLPGTRMAFVLSDGTPLASHVPAGTRMPRLQDHNAFMQTLREGEPAGILSVHSPLDGAQTILSYDRSLRHPVIALTGILEAELWIAWLKTNRWLVATGLLLVLGALAGNVAAFARFARGLDVASRDLKSSEARFREGIENIRDGVALWDRDDRLVVCNDMCRRIYAPIAHALAPGAAYGDLTAMLIRHVLAGRPDDEIEATIVTAIAGHRRADGERIQERPDGTVIAINEVPTGDGGIMSTYRDVSAERRAMRALAASEAQFRDAIHSISEGFVLWSKDERLVIWNRRVIDLLPHLDGVLAVGLTLEAFYDAAIDHARPDWPFERRSEWKAMRRSCRTAFSRAELRVRSGLIVEALEQPLSNGGVVTIYRDITAERRLVETLRERESQLIQALAAERETNAEQRRFVAIASHEFRTPLAIIDGATQRLEARLAPVDDDVGNRLQRIRGAVARMTQIIERTLSSARLDGGRMEMNWQHMDLAQLVREVCERERQISVRFTIVTSGIEEPLLIDGDPKLLEQVLANLLSNAVKYSGAARDIGVELRRAGDHAEVVVSDAGVGIPDDEIDQLFTRFYRARTAQGISGTGIGLHLVRELVTLHGGRVSVASTLGKGSTFTVRLPIARSDISTADKQAA